MSSYYDDLFAAARFTNTQIRLVCQTPAPSKCVLLSTSWVVRGLMKDWVLSDSGDTWSVELDVRDLGGHLDTTCRRRATTLVARVVLLLARILVVMALPLDFARKLRVLRNKVLPGALRCVEASALSLGLLHQLRSAFVSAVWSRRMPLPHTGAVLFLISSGIRVGLGGFVRVFLF